MHFLEQAGPSSLTQMPATLREEVAGIWASQTFATGDSASTAWLESLLRGSMPGLAVDGKGEPLPEDSAGRPLLPARLRDSLRLVLGARLVLAGEDSDAWDFLEPPEGDSEATLEEILLRFACLRGPDGPAWNPLTAERLESHVLQPLRALAANPISADSARPWLGRVIRDRPAPSAMLC